MSPFFLQLCLDFGWVFPANTFPFPPRGNLPSLTTQDTGYADFHFSLSFDLNYRAGLSLPVMAALNDLFWKQLWKKKIKMILNKTPQTVGY